jgi:hypothetical protein
VSLPVDPERLKREFPELSDDDLAAYVEVTQRILAAGPRDRGRLTREAVEGGRKAQELASASARLTAEQKLWLRYVVAVDKMQRSTVRPPR